MSEEEKEAYDKLVILKYFTIEKEDKKSIEIILNLIDRQQKELETKTAKMTKDAMEIAKMKQTIEEQTKEIKEKTTILFAGAEKVRQLEKDIETLIKQKNQ